MEQTRRDLEADAKSEAATRDKNVSATQFSPSPGPSPKGGGQAPSPPEGEGRGEGDSFEAETVCLPLQAPEALERALDALRRGEVIAFPTDTIYGLGAHAFLPEAVARLYAIKERPGSQAIPLLLPDAAALERVCDPVPPLAWLLAERFWPGALSLVLPRSAAVPDAVTAGGPTVAVRVPDHDLVRELGRRLGAPLAATSANRHGQPDPVTAAEVLAQLGGRVPLLLDGGRCPGGVASTVLDLSVSPPVILRPGPVTAEQLAAVVPARGD